MFKKTCFHTFFYFGFFCKTERLTLPAQQKQSATEKMATDAQSQEIEVPETFQELEAEFTDDKLEGITIDTVVCSSQ